MKILVPLDGSPLAEVALPVAERLAKRLTATIVLVSVAPPPESAAQTAEARDLLIRQLEPAVERLRGLPVEERLELLGEPAEGIVQVAREEDVAMIVMATHGRSGLSDLVQGSTAEAVLRRSPVPVTLVRPNPAT
ncbi:MAG TPA: universal stress protein [Dehalococcoidia bacterium]